MSARLRAGSGAVKRCVQCSSQQDRPACVLVINYNQEFCSQKLQQVRQQRSLKMTFNFQFSLSLYDTQKLHAKLDAALDLFIASTWFMVW